ncbi:MAG TPA: hypothetical protein VFZ69_11160 [Longimicrobiales bacterium]
MSDTTECAGVRELLLTAEPGELQGTGDSPVARHVRECARCARDAGRILEAQDELGAALATLGRGEAPTRTRVRRRAPGFAAALTAAAAVTLLLLRPGAERELEPLPGPTVVVTEVPIVNAAGLDAVAVMQTGNPRITVVWYLQRERQR